MRKLAILIVSMIVMAMAFATRANATTVVLDPGPGTDYLAVWCGGQAVNEIATGFDTSGNAVTLVKVSTTCHGSGRGSPNQYNLACWTVTFAQDGTIVSQLELGTYQWSQGHAAIPCPVPADPTAVYTYTDGAGNFPATLSTSVIGSSATDSAVLETTCTPTAYGDMMAGTISAQAQACYSFSGSAGNGVEVNVAKTSGTLVPVTEIHRPNGTVLCSVVSAVLDCKLDATGLHTIVVRDSTGSGTGDFTMALTRTDVPNLTIGMTGTFTSSRLTRTLAYAITVANTGGAAATDVVVTDTLPKGLLIRNLSSTQGTCSRAQSAVTCTLGSVGPSQSVTVNIGTTTALSSGQITNTACVATNNCATAVTNLQ